MATEKNKLKENISHGSIMFPLYVYNNNHISNQSSLFSHWHEDIEIIYIEDGEFILNIDMKPITAKKGECYFINSEVLHSAYSLNGKDAVYHAIVFDVNILSSSIYDYCQSKFIDPLINKHYLFPMFINPLENYSNEIIDEVKRIIMSYQYKNTGWELCIKSSLLKIISLFAYYNKFEVHKEISLSRKNYKIDLIKKVISYIHLNYNKKIYIDDLSKEVNMNPQYFCRFFKSLTGKTPIDYINFYRIDKAAKILKTEDKKIIDVSFEVGFDNFSYFIKKFKEYKKCTPSKFKTKS